MRNFSLGIWIVLLMAIASSAYLIMPREENKEGVELWVFARQHFEVSQSFANEWSLKNPQNKVRAVLVSFQALERRILSASMSGTPIAPFFEVEQSVAARLTSGPIEEIGLRDLTDVLIRDGLMESMNKPSFSLWTIKGRIYGLPHDVHPVLLAYRSDIVEAAGIDVNQIETWADFIRILKPLQRRGQSDSSKDRYLLNFWSTNQIALEILLFQAGGQYFNELGQPVLNSEINVEVLATLATWCFGENRIAIDTPEYSASGNKLKLDGQVIASVMPDWLAGGWKSDLPGLSGKLKLMPLPAWEKGGLRTSVYGGTMLGFPKDGKNFEQDWKFALALYRSPEMTDALYRKANTIPPDRLLWKRPIYQEPDPYFSGQASGQLFIDQAPNVPLRQSSPFSNQARNEVGNALQRLVAYAESQGLNQPEELKAKSREQLNEAQNNLQRQIQRNVFQRTEP